jgi:hypothetical protein
MIDNKKIKARRKRGPGRPWGSRTTFIGKAVGLRLYPEMETRLDAWIERQNEPGLRWPEAIRRLVDRALSLEESLAVERLERALATDTSRPTKPAKSRRPAKGKDEPR